MLNQIVIVGRLTSDPQINEVDGRKVCTITLAVPRSFKNDEGEYETDFIDCVVWDAIAENTSEYCKKGDLIGVRGRLQTRNVEKDGENKKITELIAEKIASLTSKKDDE